MKRNSEYINLYDLGFGLIFTYIVILKYNINKIKLAMKLPKI